MAKGTKGIVGQYTSTRGILSWAVAAGLTIAAYKKLEKDAADPAKKGSITGKVAGMLGFTGPGTAA